MREHPVLFTAEGMAPLRERFGTWPRECLRDLGFEIRLDGDPTVDLSGLVTQPTQSRALLAPIVPMAWSPLLDLLEAWASRWRDQLYNLWFEFDARQVRPMPAVFVQRCFPKPHPKGNLQNAFAALAMLGVPVAADFIAITEAAEPHVCYVGALLSRADHLYRLALPATAANMADVLGLLRWSGDAATLQALLEDLSPAHPRQGFGLDVDWADGRLLPRIGIDVTLPDSKRIMPWLVERGLATQRIAEQLARVFLMSHVKLVFDGHQVVQAKAYLRYASSR